MLETSFDRRFIFSSIPPQSTGAHGETIEYWLSVTDPYLQNTNAISLHRTLVEHFLKAKHDSDALESIYDNLIELEFLFRF